MGLVEDFPEDPFTPSLRYAATCRLPVTVPWSKEPIKLGTTLSVSRTPGERSEFTDRTAFSKSALELSKMAFTGSSAGNTSEASTSGSAASSEHTDLSISGQIGGSFIGASGRAKYEKHVGSDRSSNRSSFRTTYRSGRVIFAELPRLSTEAVELLRTSRDPDKAFNEKFGEYYVAAYIFGGSNASMLGAQAASESAYKDLSGSFTVKVLFVSKTKEFEDHERSGSGVASGSLSAFDTLDGWEANMSTSDSGSFEKMKRDAADNTAKGWSLPNRVDARTRDLGLGMEREISWSKCEDVFRAGLVVELLLMPYSGLKEYVAAVLAGL